MTLAVSREDARSSSYRLRFTVIDTGIGISAERQSLLFQRFSQGDGSITRRFGGTGLGLAISKNLVHLMHGDIGVQSVEGQGSSFWFTIELAAPPLESTNPKQAPVTSDAARPMNVLLVEDVEINQDLARLVLESQGHVVDIACDGTEAVKKVQDKPFDIVLMDVQMPVMDGMAATRHIRALNHPCNLVPIIAMTANVLPQQISAFRLAGMDDHVGKPFNRKELFDTIAFWTKTRPMRQEVPATVDRETFSNVPNWFDKRPSID